jgi:hypothetical protein
MLRYVDERAREGTIECKLIRAGLDTRPKKML